MVFELSWGRDIGEESVWCVMLQSVAIRMSDDLGDDACVSCVAVREHSYMKKGKEVAVVCPTTTTDRRRRGKPSQKFILT